MLQTLTVQKRIVKGNTDILRQSGKIPGIMYGPGIEPVMFSIDNVEFKKIYKDVGESTLIDLCVEGNKDLVKVLIQDIQYDPVKQEPIHIDLRQINIGEEMEATIELMLVGVSPAVKEQGGTLVHPHKAIEVKCLPKDLVGNIEIDISGLVTFDDVIHTKDIVMPSGMTILDDLDIVIAKVTPPLTEEQLKAMEDGDQKTVEDVEIEEKGKKEEENKTEGREENEEKKEEEK